MNADMNEYYKFEIAQVFSRIDSIEKLRIQLGTFFGTANLTALGIAVSSQKAGIFFIASAILLIFFIIDTQGRKSLAVYYYRGLQLQRKFAPDDNETFLHILPGKTIGKIREIIEIKESQSRLESVNKIYKETLSITGFWIPLSVILFEIVAGSIFRLMFRWSLF